MASLKSSMICATLMAVAALSVTAAQSGEADRMHLGFVPAVGSRCTGSLAECLSEEEEFAMDSESNRRVGWVHLHVGA